jgi:hypothetical protein
MTTLGPAEDRLKKLWTDPRQPIFGSEQHGSDQRWVILSCPTCVTQGERYPSALHMRLGQMVVWPDLDDYDSPAGLRGEFVIIPMECECGARFGLQITNHKGSQLLSMLTYRGNPSIGDLYERR